MNEEVKKEVEKVNYDGGIKDGTHYHKIEVKAPEEVEEVSEKEAEEVQAVAEEVEQKNDVKLLNIEKLKCNYAVYKRERTKLKMSVIEKCQECGKQFKDGDRLYTGYIEKDNIKQSYLICKNCAE